MLDVSKTSVNSFQASEQVRDSFRYKFGGNLDYYEQSIPELSEPDLVPFYRLLLSIWQLRPSDLQKIYPLNTRHERLGYLSWCVLHGVNEYLILKEFSPFWSILSQPAKLSNSLWSAGISRHMQLIVFGNADIDLTFSTVTQQYNVLAWFCVSGFREMNMLETLPIWQKDYLRNTMKNGLSLFSNILYQNNEKLINTFDINTKQGVKEYKQWLDDQIIYDPVIRCFHGPSRGFNRKYKLQPVIKPSFQFGVNLIGYAYGELGIGEDVRMAALALNAAGIPFTVIDFSPGLDVRQNDRSIEQWVTNEPKYSINLVCLTAVEHLRLYAERGASLFKNRYTIGYWPWELKRWPVSWKHCFNLVDEVWASSQYIRETLETVSYVPVITMPMAVLLPDHIIKSRKRFNLPQKKVLFVFSFDGNSSLARKNPLAVVNAFHKAFQSGTEPVGLVIKCMRPDADNLIWQTILTKSKKDPRIHIIDAVLSKSEVLSLYKSCDCFVSLHRAEGFGRGIAEALLLGLDVITTSFGGNVDFCVPAGASLVSYKLISVGKDQYIDNDGQSWADPDIDIAASEMKKIYQKRKNRNSITKVPLTLKQLFQPNVIGNRYKQRLEEIGQYLNISSRITCDT